MALVFLGQMGAGSKLASLLAGPYICGLLCLYSASTVEKGSL
jgi:hypothetical protein